MTLRWLSVPILTIALAAPSMAATILVTSVDGTWNTALPNVSGITINNALNPREVSWGDFHGSPNGPSKYQFAPNAAAIAAITLPPSPSPFFLIGTFTHQNFLIDPPFLTSVDLTIALAFQINGTPTTQNFTYLFQHEETSNSLNPCPYDPVPPVNGCSDRVTITSPAPATFMVNGVNYTLELSFQSAGVPVTQFITAEQQANTAQIFGRFTAASTTTPEPGTVGLVGLALVGFGAGAIRKRRAS
jgi:hypothetical protein